MYLHHTQPLVATILDYEFVVFFGLVILFFAGAITALICTIVSNFKEGDSK